MKMIETFRWKNWNVELTKDREQSCRAKQIAEC
jgi:hypothetical protein